MFSFNKFDNKKTSSKVFVPKQKSEQTGMNLQKKKPKITWPLLTLY